MYLTVLIIVHRLRRRSNFFIKLLKTSIKNIASACQDHFWFHPPFYKMSGFGCRCTTSKIWVALFPHFFSSFGFPVPFFPSPLLFAPSEAIYLMRTQTR